MKKENLKIFLWVGLVAVIIAIQVIFADGLGQFWDWAFPFYQHQLTTFATNHLSSWESYHYGQPQAYMPSLFYYLVIGGLGSFVATPEFILSSLIAVGLGVGILLCYRLFRAQANLLLLPVILVAVLNPAIFYKLLAGHIPYFLSYILLLGTFWYLFNRYQTTLRSAIALGLLLALTGIQVQFLLFSFLISVIFFLFYKEKFSLKYFAVSWVIAGLIHFFWLSNFFSGVVDFQAVSSLANADSFASLERGPFLNVFRQTFTDATFIGKFFTAPYQLLAAAFTASVLLGLALYGQMSRLTKFWLTLWLLFTFLATGTFHSLPIPILESLYPLLREAGHAAPLAVLSLVGVAAAVVTSRQKLLAPAVAVFATLLVLGSAYQILANTPKINFNQARGEFKEFNELYQQDPGIYRVLTFPFFHQYRFVDQPQTEKKGTPMSNSGWDSYTLFSGFEYLDNSQSFKGPQAEFLRSYDLKVLEPYNIKYIFDYFDGTYRSEADHFLSDSLYTDELHAQNNDPDFIEKIQAANPGQLQQVSSRVWEITTYRPRLELLGGQAQMVRRSSTYYELGLTMQEPETSLLLRSRFHPGWRVYLQPYAPLNCPCADSAQALSTKTLHLNNLAPLELLHTKTAADTNEWLVSKQKLLDAGQEFYQSNDNGEVKVRAVVAFAPEYDHMVALGVSLLALALSLGYLVITFRRRPSDV